MKQNKTISNKVKKNIEKDLKQAGSIKLRERLPRAAIQEIADVLGISWTWAFKVISGKYKGDPHIISMALEYIKIEDEKRERISELIERNNKELQDIE